MSPLHLWNISVSRHGMDPLPDPHRVAVALSLIEYRAPQEYGIEYLGLKYNSPLLTAFRARPRAPRLVRIAINPLDLTSIMFLDPEDGEFHAVPIHPAMAARVRGVTLERHKLARAMQRACPDRLGGDDGIDKAYAILDDEMRKLSGADGLAGRRKAARQWEALTKAKPPEEPPAFDVAESGKSVIGTILDRLGGAGDAPAPPVPGAADGIGPGDAGQDRLPPNPRAPRKPKASAPSDAVARDGRPSEPQVPEAMQDDLDDLAPLPVAIRIKR